MPFRFGKSLRVGKNIRLNVSKSGIGVSAGVKGMRISKGPRGTRVSASIPKTGISYQKQVGKAGKRKRWWLLWLAVILVGCGGSAAPTAQQVVDNFKAAGLEVQNARPGERDEKTLVPNSYTSWLQFEVTGAQKDKGGQVFTCDTKKNCDALYSFYTAMSGLVGPYVYQSPNGLVVAQMNSGLTPDVAAKYENIIKEFK